MSINRNTVRTPATADILHGVASTATTIITIPANRTWQGWISINACLTLAASAAGVSSRATVSTAGSTVTPAAGVVLGVFCSAPTQLATTTAQVSNSDRIFATIVAGTSAATVTLQPNSVSSCSATCWGELLPAGT